MKKIEQLEEVDCAAITKEEHNHLASLEQEEQLEEQQLGELELGASGAAKTLEADILIGLSPIVSRRARRA